MDIKIIKCRSTLDKLYLFLEQANDDKVIDASELKIFNKIINEYYSGKEDEIKTDNNKGEFDQRSANEVIKQNLVQIEDFKIKVKRGNRAFIAQEIQIKSKEIDLSYKYLCCSLI